MTPLEQLQHAAADLTADDAMTIANRLETLAVERATDRIRRFYEALAALGMAVYGERYAVEVEIEIAHERLTNDENDEGKQ